MSLDSLGTPYIPGITALGRVESESDFAELGEGQQDELEDQLNELEDDTEAEGQMNKAAIKARMAEMSLEGDYEPLFEKLPAKTTGSKTMAELYRMMENGEIDLEPDYQREVVWSRDRSAQLIDSLWSGMHIPELLFNSVDSEVMFVDDDGNSTPRKVLICMDGKQRLSSIHGFMRGDWPISDGKNRFYYQPSLEQPKCRSLSPAARASFDQLRLGYVVYDGLSDEQERELFQRVQQGMPLNGAEKLSSYRGPFADWISSYIAEVCNPASSTTLTPRIIRFRRRGEFPAFARALIALEDGLPDAKWRDNVALQKLLVSRTAPDSSLKLTAKKTFDRIIRLSCKPSLDPALRYPAADAKVLPSGTPFPHPAFRPRAARVLSPVEFTLLPLLVHHFYAERDGAVLEIIERFVKNAESTHGGRLVSTAAVFNSLLKWMRSFDLSTLTSKYNDDGSLCSAPASTSDSSSQPQPAPQPMPTPPAPASSSSIAGRPAANPLFGINTPRSTDASTPQAAVSRAPAATPTSPPPPARLLPVQHSSSSIKVDPILNLQAVAAACFAEGKSNPDTTRALRASIKAAAGGAWGAERDLGRHRPDLQSHATAQSGSRVAQAAQAVEAVMQAAWSTGMGPASSLRESELRVLVAAAEVAYMKANGSLTGFATAWDSAIVATRAKNPPPPPAPGVNFAFAKPVADSHSSRRDLTGQQRMPPGPQPSPKASTSTAGPSARTVRILDNLKQLPFARSALAVAPPQPLSTSIPPRRDAAPRSSTDVGDTALRHAGEKTRVTSAEGSAGPSAPHGRARSPSPVELKHASGSLVAPRSPLEPPPARASKISPSTSASSSNLAVNVHGKRPLEQAAVPLETSEQKRAMIMSFWDDSDEDDDEPPPKPFTKIASPTGGGSASGKAALIASKTSNGDASSGSDDDIIFM